MSPLLGAILVSWACMAPVLAVVVWLYHDERKQRLEEVARWREVADALNVAITRNTRPSVER